MMWEYADFVRSCDTYACGSEANRIVMIRYARPGIPPVVTGKSLCDSCLDDALSGTWDDFLSRTQYQGEFHYIRERETETLPTQADVIAREEGIRRYADGQSLAISFYDQGD